MKIYLRKPNLEAKEDEAPFLEISCDNLAEAKSIKQTGDKIHLCFHDEKPVRPCRLI